MVLKLARKKCKCPGANGPGAVVPFKKAGGCSLGGASRLLFGADYLYKNFCPFVM